MNKRVENIIKRIEKNNGKRITLRRDVLVKMAQEKLFDYMNSYSYDEMFGVSELEGVKGDFIKNCESVKNSSGGFCSVSLEGNILDFFCYIHSNRSFNLYIEINKDSKENKCIEDAEIILNEEKNGVEIYFNNKPSEEVRKDLKNNGFRWSKYNNCWYAKQNEDTLIFANSFIKEETATTEGITENEKKELTAEAEEYTNKVLKEEIEILDSLDIEPIEEKEADNNIFIDCKIARKACDLEDVKNWETDTKVVISKYIVFSNNDFDLLSNNLLTDCSAIAGYGGSRGFKNGIEVDYNSYKSISEFYNDKTIDVYCNSILITNEDGTKFLVVDPEGYKYCRYTGVLEASRGKKILMQLKGNNNDIKPHLEIINNTLVKNNDNKFKQLESEFIALEVRLNMVSSKKLKYKIETQIQSKLQEIANYIKNDPILFDTFMSQYEK